jgi:hypothetical protein
MPDKTELQTLINDPLFMKRNPPAWDQFPSEMGEQIVKGLARLSGKPSGTWQELFQNWTAVHANFVTPRFRTDDDLAAPYSIGDTFSISSCCVELFNLLDSGEKTLLVRPCTGAALIQAMERDRYYLVQLVKNAAQA